MAILLAVILRVFFIASFKIPSQSMSPAIEAGDYILVNKMVPGARIITDCNFIKDGTRPDIWRSPGFQEIERNDVLVFNYPYRKSNKLHPDMNTYYVKRCVALPGDTFYIKNGFYKVNSLPDTLGNIENQQKFLEVDEKQISKKVFQCMPKRNENYYWTVRNFGPFYVPAKNDSIAIDEINIVLYKKLIEYETGEKVKVKEGKIYLNNKALSGYRFSMNYYFMTGDNVADSGDSRYWGVLPEDHIIGKAVLVWKSENPESGEFNWKRFFKSIK